MNDYAAGQGAGKIAKWTRHRGTSKRQWPGGKGDARDGENEAQQAGGKEVLPPHSIARVCLPGSGIASRRRLAGCSRGSRSRCAGRGPTGHECTGQKAEA